MRGIKNSKQKFKKLDFGNPTLENDGIHDAPKGICNKNKNCVGISAIWALNVFKNREIV